ncbi:MULTISPECIES: hypothetical protein [Aerosakkonema]|uniref:hypothetical protein n=1 Tax=Aerosakkonema TaxID=1246629 RepID=UPI0035BA0699
MSAINHESNNRAVEQRARSLMLNHQRSMENRQKAMLIRSAREVGVANNISE